MKLLRASNLTALVSGEKWGARASRAHWPASRRPAGLIAIVTSQFGACAKETIGETPLAATGTVALPICNRTGPAGREAAGWSANRSRRAFTMIEIAISLAIIGFALAAIVGVLPLGMNVQKENRQETIVNGDNSIWMDAIRNGARGMDDLTNYVLAITNTIIGYNARNLVDSKFSFWYTPVRSSTGIQYPLTNGLRIVGLLSTPTYITRVNADGTYAGFYSNRVSAYVRSMSGMASEKFPQQNLDVQNLAFSYRLTPEIIDFGTNYYDPTWQIDPGFPAGSSNAIAWTNYYRGLVIQQGNLHDIRLAYRWPLGANNVPGASQQAFRSLVAGPLIETNEPGYPISALSYNLYFFQTRSYTNSAINAAIP